MNALVLILAIVLIAALLAGPLAARLRRPQTRQIPADIAAQASAFVAARRGFAPGMAMHGNVVLNRMEEERKRCVEFIDNLLKQVETEGRDLVDAEKSTLKAQRERIAELDEQIEPLREFEGLRDAHTETTSRYVPSAPPAAGTDTGGQRGSALGAQVNEKAYAYRSVGDFLADAMRTVPGQSRGAGGERISQAARDGALERLRSHGITVEGGQLMRASAPHNTTAEVPGLLPETIIGPIMSDVDAARPFISSIGARDLGGIPGTTFERPVVTQHAQVAKQSAEKAEVANRQFTVGGIPFTKDTYGGWANVSRQSIDWTSPGVWDALMTDFIEQYGLSTENAAADAFATAIVQTQELATSTTIAAATLPELIQALYKAAVKCYQASGRLPDTIWASLDWWPILGVLIDTLKSNTAGNGGGDSALSSFAGNLLNVERFIVPSFATETLVVGVKSRTEVYEDRFGFLSAVQPKVFGVELAYGGYMASGTLKPSAFCKIVKKP